jgi:hypothetical protein
MSEVPTRPRGKVRTVMQEYLAFITRSVRRLRTPGSVPPSVPGTWIRADSVRILWFIQTYRDLPELRKTLWRVRTLYPEAPLLVVSDGDPDPEIKWVCDSYSAEFRLRSRLYGVEHGGALVQNLLEAFLSTDADILIKIDPDTDVRRRLSLLPSPTDSSIFGTVQSAGSTRALSIQGGCIVVPRAAAMVLAGSGLLNSERLKPPALEWTLDATSRARAASGLTSSDQTLGWACRELGVPCKDHPEVCSGYQPSLMDTITARRVAVFHPRFEMKHLVDPAFYFSGLRTAVRDALRTREDCGAH